MVYMIWRVLLFMFGTLLAVCLMFAIAVVLVCGIQILIEEVKGDNRKGGGER